MTAPAPDTAAVVARLEAAEVGSRELDAMIAEALGRTVEWHIDPQFPNAAAPRLPMQLTSWGGEAVPLYTTSLDAALTLVPEGYSGDMRWSGFSHFVQVNLHDPKRSPSAIDRGNAWRGELQREPVSIPICICIAALRAREARP